MSSSRESEVLSIAANARKADKDLSLREYVQKYPFKTVLGFWGTLLVGTGAYLWKRQLPRQIKIIQARMVAQFGLLTGCIGFGLLSTFSPKPDRASTASTSWKVRSVIPTTPSSPPVASHDTPSTDAKLQ